MLTPTKFNDNIIIYEKKLTQDASGSSVQTIEEVGKYHADVRNFKTQDYAKNNLEIGQYIITVALRSKVKIDIKNNLISFNGVLYDISNIVFYKKQGYKILTCQINKDNYYATI